MFWFQQGLCFLPAFLVIWSWTTFSVSYIVAIVRQDVRIFPYISDTGAKPPESCIFGLMTFISACAGIGTIYARYKYVEKRDEKNREVNKSLNKAALCFGLLSCLGMCIVGTFQTSSQEAAVTVLHYIGAALFFLCGILYLILETTVSYKACPEDSSMCVFGVRLCLIVVATLTFLGTVICVLSVRVAMWHGTPPDKVDHYDLPGAVCEWFAALSFICFFFTYIDDFKLFTLKVKIEYEDVS